MQQNKDVVLVVDDGAVRSALKFLLEIVGFNVRLCDTLATTLAIVATGRCGCIVLEERRSAVDSLRLLQRLRAHAYGTPVIVLSPGLDREARQRALGAGVQIVLDFPIVDRSLLEAVRTACRTSAALSAGT